MSSDRKPPPRHAIYLIKHVQNALKLAMDEALEPTGLTVAQVAVLSALRSEPQLSNADLARLSFVTPQSMVPLLQSLEKRRLIIRRPHPDGGRSMPAELTPRGLEQLQISWGILKKVEELMLGGLADTDRLRLRELLESCLAALRPPPLDP